MTTADPSTGSSRRSMLVVVVLLGAAALLGLVADSTTATEDGGASGALAVLALALIPALFAVPPLVRRLLGGVSVGVTLVVSLVWVGGRDTAVLEWVQVAALALAGLLTVWRGGSWRASGLGFGRSDSRSATTAHPSDIWRALDRGEDPTAASEGQADMPDRDPPANGPGVP